MGRDVALRVAELLDEPAEYVIACIEHEREPSAGVRRIWKRIAEAFRSKAAALAITLIAPLGLWPAPSPVQAQALTRELPQLSAGALYIMRRRSRRRARRWTDLLGSWLLWTPRPAPAWGRV